MSEPQANDGNPVGQMALGGALFQDTRARRGSGRRAGKSNINGARAKPSRAVRSRRRIDDPPRLLRVDSDRQRALTATRSGYASATLYEETEESKRKREAATAQLKLERPTEFDSPGRPSKKDRRAIAKFTKRG